MCALQPKTRRNIFRSDNSTSELNLTGLKVNGSSDKNAALQNGSPMDVDPVYWLLKQGSALNSQKGTKTEGSDSGIGSSSDRRVSKTSAESVASSLRNMMTRRNSSMSEPESVDPKTRPMLNQRMKSISLDSPEQLYENVVPGRTGRPVLERGQSTVGQLPGNLVT